MARSDATFPFGEPRLFRGNCSRPDYTPNRKHAVRGRKAGRPPILAGDRTLSFLLWVSASHSESSHVNSSRSCFHRGGLEGLVAGSTCLSALRFVSRLARAYRLVVSTRA